MDFKFQSDSINTSEAVNVPILANSFKFQSDSINTNLPAVLNGGVTSLNSNLILLIRALPQITVNLNIL